MIRLHSISGSGRSVIVPPTIAVVHGSMWVLVRWRHRPGCRDILMYDHEAAMSAYVQLAVLSDEKQQALVRDRFLLLAAVEACRAGWLDVAARCREKLLLSNPTHQLGHFATVADALRDSDFPRLVVKWERYCPFEQAEHLLLQLGMSPKIDDTNISLGEQLLKLLSK